MEADIDFDVLVHLGRFHALDISRRGIFAIRVCLSIGDEINFGSLHYNFNELNHDNMNVDTSRGSRQHPSSKSTFITPVGCFSAPTSFNAFINDYELDCPPPIYPSYVEDSDKSFRSRSFIIRYRDEVHVRYFNF